MSVHLPALHLQTVLDALPVAALWRSLRGVMAAFNAARAAGMVDRLAVHVGDRSATPLSDAILDDLALLFDGTGAELHYSHGLAAATGAAHDQLAAAAASNHLVVLRGGAYPSPTFLTGLLGRAADPDVAIADARSLPLENPKTFDAQTGDTELADLGGALVRCSALDEVGGFDNGVGIEAIGVDLSWRLRQAGHRIVHVPRATYFDDRRPAEDGSVPDPANSADQGTLDRLLLAHRFGNRQIAAEIVNHVEVHGEDGHRRALERYRLLESRGELPEPLAGAVGGYFVGGHYTATRF